MPKQAQWADVSVSNGVLTNENACLGMWVVQPSCHASFACLMASSSGTLSRNLGVLFEVMWGG